MKAPNPAISPEHLIRQSEHLIEEGKLEAALDILEGVLASSPENVNALNNAALVAIELGDPAKGAEHLEKALEVDPGHEASFYNLLDFAIEEREFELAKEIYENHQEHISPSKEKATYQKHLFPRLPGGHSRVQGNLQEALETFTRALGQDASDAAAHDAGLAAWELGHLVDAIEYFERALEAQPGHQGAFYSLIDLLIDQESNELAVETFLRYHEEMPDDEEKAKYLDALATWADQQPSGEPSGDGAAGQAVAQADTEGPAYLRLLKRLHEQLKPATYVEVGVYKGASLALASPETISVGIDPQPAVGAPHLASTSLYRLTSDAFFEEEDLHAILGQQPVDLAFIDGMHLFEYALRDFINLERHCTSQSVILIHDCLPVDRTTASRQRTTSFWSGDIWKLILCLKAYRPDLHIATVDVAPTGLGIITNLDPTSEVLRENLDAIYDEYVQMDYSVLDESKAEKLNRIPNDLEAVANVLPLEQPVRDRSALKAAAGDGHLSSAESVALSHQAANEQSPASQVTEGMVSIVIATVTIDYLDACISSITENTDDSVDYEIIIVNDGSGESALLEYLDQTPHHVITLSQNNGFAKANNAGFQAAQGEYIMTLNADTLVHPGWLSEMLSTLNMSKGIAAVGPTVLDMGTETVQRAGSNWDDDNYRKFSVQHAGLKRSKCQPVNTRYQVDAFSGVCMLFKRDRLFEVGLFDERFLNGWEDMDICMSLLDQGYTLYHAPAVIEHKSGFVRNKFDLDYYQQLVQSNRRHFLEKWGSYAIEQHRLLPKQTPNAQTATASPREVGPGSGEQVATSAPMKVAFICGPDQKFVTELEDRTARQHHVKTLHFTDRLDLQSVQEVLDWADVTWFEWCDQILIEASQKLRKTSKVVCRLHSYEVFTEMPRMVQWDFVDQVVFVAPHIERIFQATVDTKVATSVIPNGVNLDALHFKERTPSFDLAYVGYINHKKNPELLLQCMAELVKRDERYVLHIAGEFQELRYKLYFEKMIPALGLEGKVKYYGWVDDIDAWLEDKSYLVSTSVLESFGMGIAEAMAKGIKPLIHNWVGAEEIYPEHLLFNTPSEFADSITEMGYDSPSYRHYIKQNYAIEKQVGNVDRVLSSVAQSGITSPKPSSFSSSSYWKSDIV